MKRKISLLLLCAMLLALTACGQSTPSNQPQTTDTPTSATAAPPEEPTPEPVEEVPLETVTDPSGATITIPAEVNTIISIAPAISSTIAALGLGDKVIAYDTWSVGIEGLPTGLPTFDMVNPDVEQLVAMAPDVLLVSGLALYDQDSPYQPLLDAGICVVNLPTSDSIDDVKYDISFIAKVLHAEEAGEAVIDQLNAELDELAAIAATIPEEERKTVYFEISPAPYMYSTNSKTYLGEMIEFVGGINVFADDENLWPSISDESLVERNPDVIFTYTNYIEDPVGEIMGRDGWAALTAVVNGDVYYVDNNSSAQPNQNITIAMRQMAEAMYPDYYTAE